MLRVLAGAGCTTGVGSVVAGGVCVLDGNGNGVAEVSCTEATPDWTGAVVVGSDGAGIGAVSATARSGWYADSTSANATPAATANRSRPMVANRNRGNASPPKEARVAHP